jgi:hypothetical protein
LPNTIWAKNFLEAQGYDIIENVFHQDNQSAIRMEKNGRASAGQKSRHINIRYFFIKDRILDGDMDVIYCPTELMLADFYTKPLQGSLFKKFRSVILGYEHVSILERDASTMVEERVGGEHPGAERPVVNDVDESEESEEEEIVDQPDPSEWTVVKRRVSFSSLQKADGRSSGKAHVRVAEKAIKRSTEKYEEKKGEDVSSPHTLKIIPS